MRIAAIAALGALIAALGGAASAEDAPKGSVDYGKASSWLCRPGDEAKCVSDLDAIAVDASGARTPLPPFKAVEDARVDCFFVYPTVSTEASTYADLAPSPEIVRTAHGQVGRYGQVCRVFVPLYRQLTLKALADSQSGKDLGKTAFDPPYEDVKAAWKYYLAHENGGRGVILIGHSQGAILLSRLMSEEMDGPRRHDFLVAAHLGGHPGIAVPKGKDVGGTYRTIPICRTADQADCIVVWGTYTSDDASPSRFFGRHPAKPGFEAACVNPAAPQGGRSMLHAFLRKPSAAPESDPPYVELIGQISGECVSDAQGNVLRVTVEPGKYSGLLTGALKAYGLGENWGLHRLDFSLPQGDLVDLAARESAAWEHEAK